MALTDLIPHGMVAAFGAIVTYVYREHVKQDDRRFDRIAENLDAIAAAQVTTAETIADTHAEVLKLFIAAGQQAATNQAISEATAARGAPRG
jgi:hypothetical protein